jgi:hypothetical protein
MLKIRPKSKVYVLCRIILVEYYAERSGNNGSDSQVLGDGHEKFDDLLDKDWPRFLGRGHFCEAAKPHGGASANAAGRSVNRLVSARGHLRHGVFARLADIRKMRLHANRYPATTRFHVCTVLLYIVATHFS